MAVLIVHVLRSLAVDAFRMLGDACVMKIVTWNLERRKVTSAAGSTAVEYLHSQAPDLMFLTETRTDFPQLDGHMAFGNHPGAHFAENERKVAIWSKFPLEQIDSVGDQRLPPNRYVSATVNTPSGKLRIICVCIPWHMANVRYGNKNRKPWQSRIEFLEILPEVLNQFDEPIIIAGDFNQRIPRVKGGVIAAAEAMQKCFKGYDIVTEGVIDGLKRPGIDHVALGPEFRCSKVFGWSNVFKGRKVSDHDGAGCEFTVKSGKA